ncbi:MAG: ATP-binding cassette domain-containing protein [bacterium]
MLKVKNLSITYKTTGQKVINSLNFSVEKGEVVAIMGPSGCGKTTLLKAIADLFESNEIFQKGELVLKKDANIRIVFQEANLLPWRNVLRNVTFGLETQNIEDAIAIPRATNTLGLVGLSKYEKYFPHQLSLGMKQRVNFARAITCEPDILLLDEPFSALDTVIKEDIIREFKKIIKQKHITTIFVTHNEVEAKILSDKIITLGENFTGIRENDNTKARTILDPYDNLLELEG